MQKEGRLVKCIDVKARPICIPFFLALRCHTFRRIEHNQCVVAGHVNGGMRRRTFIVNKSKTITRNFNKRLFPLANESRGQYQQLGLMNLVEVYAVRQCASARLLLCNKSFYCQIDGHMQYSEQECSANIVKSSSCRLCVGLELCISPLMSILSGGSKNRTQLKTPAEKVHTL